MAVGGTVRFSLLFFRDFIKIALFVAVMCDFVFIMLQLLHFLLLLCWRVGCSGCTFATENILTLLLSHYECLKTRKNRVD